MVRWYDITVDRAVSYVAGVPFHVKYKRRLVIVPCCQIWLGEAIRGGFSMCFVIPPSTVVPMMGRTTSISFFTAVTTTIHSLLFVNTIYRFVQTGCLHAVGDGWLRRMLGSEARKLRNCFDFSLWVYRVSIRTISSLSGKANLHTYFKSLLVHHDCERRLGMVW